MSTDEKKPRCGATIEGLIVKDRGRSRPMWRRGCRRFVKQPGDRCFQHPRVPLGNPRSQP